MEIRAELFIFSKKVCVFLWIREMKRVKWWNRASAVEVALF
jgi:hypothetical protein